MAVADVSGAGRLASERFQGDATLAAVARGERTLDHGARGVAVKRVQLALVDCGYDLPRAGADGSFGREMESAVTTFQRATGVLDSGRVDAATLAALDAKVHAIDHPPAAPAQAAALDAKRFVDDPVFQAIARGERTLARGANGAAVQKLQLTLLGLGYDLPGAGADSDFGGETAGALERFQVDQGLPRTGELDRETLLQLDDAAARAVAQLKAAAVAPEEKPLRYHTVTDLRRCRIYVIDNETGSPVASYLTSPGTAGHPTRGTSFTLQSTTVLGWWRPPNSPWAQGLKPVPPGFENPMGICKLSFGAYAQYFHGIPKRAERDLGRPASHGCLRMSGTNVLELHERYAGPGTKVTLVRDAAESDRLAAKLAAAGITDRPITAGREYTAPYFYGEMGFNEKLGRNGQVTVGGRGG